MNPIKWPRHQQVALGLATILGAAAGLIVGYMMFAVAAGAEGAAGFGLWVSSMWTGGYDPWHPAYAALGGGLMATGYIYLNRLMRP